MNDFQLFLKTGLWHIADITAYDHIVFVITLCAALSFNDWKKFLWLITAFTVGHSLTLALSVLNIVVFRTSIIELLIPITIMISCVLNFYEIEKLRPKLQYFLVLFFGFIHGCGFSNYLKSLLATQDALLTQLLAFNIGIEIGQLFIVFIVWLLSYIAIKMFHVEQSKWSFFLSSAAFGIALSLFINLLTQS